MDLAEFHNGLRILINLDLADLQEQGLFTEPREGAAEKWTPFRDNPWRYFIKCDDETASKIWAAMQKRLRPAARDGGRMEVPEGWDAE